MSDPTPTADSLDADTDHLWRFLASMPAHGHGTLTRKQLRAFLLATSGQVMARGSLWSIKSKYLGAGVYRVSLEAM